MVSMVTDYQRGTLNGRIAMVAMVMGQTDTPNGRTTMVSMVMSQTVTEKGRITMVTMVMDYTYTGNGRIIQVTETDLREGTCHLLRQRLILVNGYVYDFCR